MSGTEGVPALDAVVPVPAGTYALGEPGEVREVRLEGVLVGRWPVTNADLGRFLAETGHPVDAATRARAAAAVLADHPATGVTHADALAFCDWAAATLGAVVRLPSGDEWEAAARGTDGRPFPWGNTFDPERCACAEAGWGWTAPVTAHPDGRSPCGAEQCAGNVWEWVAGELEDGWVTVRGGSYLDHAWGVRASRALAADPVRATPTTGFRIAIERRAA